MILALPQQTCPLRNKFTTGLSCSSTSIFSSTTRKIFTYGCVLDKGLLVGLQTFCILSSVYGGKERGGGRNGAGEGTGRGKEWGGDYAGVFKTTSSGIQNDPGSMFIKMRSSWYLPQDARTIPPSTPYLPAPARAGYWAGRAEDAATEMRELFEKSERYQDFLEANAVEASLQYLRGQQQCLCVNNLAVSVYVFLRSGRCSRTFI